MQKLEKTIHCWENFREIERVISDWLQNAQILLTEKCVDSSQYIEKEKVKINFFLVWNYIVLKNMYTYF